MVEQNTQEWLDMRRKCIGASDSPIILGESPWKTPFQLWEEKLGLREQPEMNKYMKRGHELEPIARHAYNKKTGHLMAPKVAFHEEYSWMMASLDGISLDGLAIVEIKCPGDRDHFAASQGIIPDKYYPQLQHQLAVTGLAKMDYFSYQEESEYIIEVERDNEFIDRMYEEEKKFYNNMVSFTPPALCDKDFIERVDPEWIGLAKQWIEKKEILSVAKKEEEEYRKLLIDISSDKCSMGGGIKATKYKRQGGVDYEAIPELNGVDLNDYRKSPVDMWRFSIN